MMGCACLAAAFALAQTPRDGWNLAIGAEDLIANGFWNCSTGVQVGSGSLTIVGGKQFNTILNTAGPRLKVSGDFSLLATISAPTASGAFVSLVGTIGVKRLDVGVAGNIQMVAWTGATPDGDSRTFALSPIPDPLNLEVARIGSDIVVFVNGAETGRMPDPGLFDSGQVYLGFNVAPGNTLSVLALAAAVPGDGSGSLSLDAPYLQTINRSGTALRDGAERHGFLVGGAVNPSLLRMDGYAQTLGGEFNTVVAENVMKFGPTEPGPGRYDFCAADQLVAFAQANHMQVRGHNLVWHQNLPNWLTQGNYSRDDAIQVLHDHIQTVVTHFKGKLLCWDVVNEAIAYGAPYGPQPSYWLDKIGPEYVDMAFRWAREADPDVKLFYNDTGGEGLGAKSDAVYNLVKGMLDRGVPLDGVGLQMHVSVTVAPSSSGLTSNIERLGKLGLEVQITEMDVRMPVPASAANLATQAEIYSRVMQACVANANCTALLTWGITDAYSWIPGAYPGFGAALLFDPQFHAKAAYQAVAGVLAAQ